MLPLAVKMLLSLIGKCCPSPQDTNAQRNAVPSARCCTTPQNAAPQRRTTSFAAKCRFALQNAVPRRKMPSVAVRCWPSLQNAVPHCKMPSAAVKMLAFTAKRCSPLQNAFRCRKRLSLSSRLSAVSLTKCENCTETHLPQLLQVKDYQYN